jgi:hypothetical protein
MTKLHSSNFGVIVPQKSYLLIGQQMSFAGFFEKSSGHHACRQSKQGNRVARWNIFKPKSQFG